ncbi:hypothetical protein D3871_15560 [Noviherbaspirillum saxi]|uniref:Uncharacterized protein n=1 Tax=Noviherbaspirillum saxi TaxID=2320863 RepID=A0A3A3FYL2_9BURK|nr:hypothetical protein D3871_15560 [Noviherbaspirillum saxi]
MVVQSIGPVSRTRLVSLTPEGRNKYGQAALIWQSVPGASNRDLGEGNVLKMHDCLRAGEDAINRILVLKEAKDPRCAAWPQEQLT